MPTGSPIRMRLTASQTTDLAKAHTQNTDTSLDLGGTNPVTAAEAKAAYDDMVWRQATTTTAAKSGAVTLTPATAANQISPVTGNITSLTCDLTATYPYVTWEVTTDGNSYTFDTTGFVKDGGAAITLPDTGTATLLIYTMDGGITKKILMTSTDEAV